MYNLQVEKIYRRENTYFETPPLEEYRVVDISCALNGGQIEIKRAQCPADQIGDWAPRREPDVGQSAPNGATAHIKILFLDDEDRRKKLPCSAATYKTLADTRELPDQTLSVLTETNGRACSLQRPYGSDVPDIIGVCFYISGMRVATVHEVKQDCTSIILSLRQSDEDELSRALDKFGEALRIPTLLPLCVLELLGEYVANSMVTRWNDIISIARETDLYAYDTVNGSGGRQDVDLLETSAQLTRIAQKAATRKSELLDLMQAQKKVREMHQGYLRRQHQSAPDGLKEACDELLARLDAFEDMTRALLISVEQLQTDVQANVQTIYSMTASRDSEQNRRAAEASIYLAEVTRRDSADMRVIAAVTLIFLPATFVATLFSTSFFDFSPRESDKVVSHWVWLYWTVAGTLTLVVLVGWVLTSRTLYKRHKVSIVIGQSVGPTDKQADSGHGSQDMDSDLDGVRQPGAPAIAGMALYDRLRHRTPVRSGGDEV